MFVYFGGQGDVQLARLRELVEGMKVGEVMITSFRTVSADAPLGSVIDQMTNRWQHDFPVVNEVGETIGLLLSRDINRALKATGELTTARQWMQSSYEVIDAEAPLEQSLHKLLSGAAPVLPVFRNGKKVGLLTSQHLKQLLDARLSQHVDHPRHDFSHSMYVPARSPISTVHHV